MSHILQLTDGDGNPANLALLIHDLDAELVGAQGHERAEGHGQHACTGLGGQAQGDRGLLQPFEGGGVIGGDGDRNDAFLGRLLGSLLAGFFARGFDRGDRPGRRGG